MIPYTAVAFLIGTSVWPLFAQSSDSTGGRVLTGRVIDREGGAPLAGAHIELTGTRYAAISRTDGSFSLGRVQRGVYALRVTRVGYRPSLRAAFVIPDSTDAGPMLMVLDAAAAPLAAMVVTPGYFTFLQPSLVSSQSLSRQQIETAPQLGEDIFRVINRLPGVAATDFSARLSVRGGLPDELYVSLDGLQLIEPFHLKDVGGAVSILDVQALGAADLTTGAPPAEYGDHVAGVLTMHSLEPRTDRAHTAAGASITNLRAMSEGGFAEGRGAWFVSARRGFLDLALRLAGASDSLSPRYEDVFAKVQYQLSDSSRVALHALYSGDYLHYLDRSEPALQSKYLGDYLWATWDAVVGSRLRASSLVSMGHLGWNRAGDGRSGTQQTAFVADQRSLSTFAAKQDWSLAVPPGALLKFGFGAASESAEYDYDAWHGVQVVDPAKQTVVTKYDTTRALIHPSGNRLSVYLAPRFRPHSSVAVEAGFRYDHVSYLGEDIVVPRVNASWEPRLGTAVRAAWGGYSQPQQLFSLQVEDGVQRFAPAERADQRVVGLEQLLPLGMAARVELYDRLLHDVRPRYVNASPSIDMFPELQGDRILIAPASSRSRGAELFLGRDGGTHVDWGLSYARASSMDVVDGAAVPRGLDQPHTVHLDWALHPESNAWRLSVAALWHTGWPFTPAVVHVDTLINTPAQFRTFSSTSYPNLNSDRLPSYQRIDARWTRFFDLRAGRISVFLEVFNLLNAGNVRGYYEHTSVAGRTVTLYRTSEYDLPRIPSAGISWEF